MTGDNEFPDGTSSPRRHSAARLAAAAFLIAVAAGACGAGSPLPASTSGPSTMAPAPTSGVPSAAAATDAPPVVATDGSQATLVDTPFSSDRYRYSLIVPPGWTINETAGSGGLHPDEPGVDTFRDREGHILSVLGEPATMPADWVSPIGQHLRRDHGLAADSQADLTVAGMPARLSEYHLPIPPSYLIHYLDTDVVGDGVGLVLSLESTTRDDAGDRAVLDAFLDSLALTGGS